MKRRGARHIFAIGGGGFNREPDSLAIERYMLRQTGVRRPSVCFIPTASAEPADYIARFEEAFSRLGARPSVLRFFDRTPDVRQLLLAQDLIYVGGGNTKSMLAVWREWGLPDVLREAWRRGVVLGGVSAGAICWFDVGVTDSWAEHLAPLPCLGLLPATCCPHYDGELDRRPSVHDFVGRDLVPPVLALDDGSAAHFVGRTLKAVVTWRPGAHGYRIRKVRGQVVETTLPRVQLRSGPAKAGPHDTTDEG
jgi:dipeptidase E